MSKSTVKPYVHAAAMLNLETLFDRAMLGISHDDRKHSESVIRMHRFFVGMDCEGKRYGVKMTVKEMREGFSHLYSIEAHDIQIGEMKNPGSEEPSGDMARSQLPKEAGEPWAISGDKTPAVWKNLVFKDFFEKFHIPDHTVSDSGGNVKSETESIPPELSVGFSGNQKYAIDAEVRESGKEKLKSFFEKEHMMMREKIDFGRFSPAVVNVLKKHLPKISYETRMDLMGSDFNHILKSHPEHTVQDLYSMTDLFDHPEKVGVQFKNEAASIWFYAAQEKEWLGIQFYGARKNRGVIKTFYSPKDIGFSQKNRGVRLESVATSDISSFDNTVANSAFSKTSPPDHTVSGSGGNVKSETESIPPELSVGFSGNQKYAIDAELRESGKEKLKSFFEKGRMMMHEKIDFGRFSPAVVNVLKKHLPEISYETRMVLMGSDFNHILKSHPEHTVQDLYSMTDLFDHPEKVGVMPRKEADTIWFYSSSGRRWLGIQYFGTNKNRGIIKTFYSRYDIEKMAEKRGVQLEAVANSVYHSDITERPGANPALIGSNSSPPDHTVSDSGENVKSETESIPPESAPGRPAKLSVPDMERDGNRIRGFFSALFEKDVNGKTDVNPVAKHLGIIFHYPRKVPSLFRIYPAASEIVTDKTEIRNWILNGNRDRDMETVFSLSFRTESGIFFRFKSMSCSRKKEVFQESSGEKKEKRLKQTHFFRTEQRIPEVTSINSSAPNPALRKSPPHPPCSCSVFTLTACRTLKDSHGRFDLGNDLSVFFAGDIQSYDIIPGSKIVAGKSA